MTRTEAIAVIVEGELSGLSDDQRESLLLDWWSIDEDDDEFHELPDLLRAEMKRSDEPDGTRKPHYDAILRIALRHRFVGVRNEYLSRRLAELGHYSTLVQGTVEPLEPCLCCWFRTLAERGNYEVCPVCSWEDDGTRDLDKVSGPNHMTLRQGRENFSRFGAVTEEAAPHDLNDATVRYERT